MNLDFSKLKSLSIDGIKLNKLYMRQYNDLMLNAIDTNGELYNGCGFMRGYRLNSSGNLTAQTNSIVSGFMPCTASSVIKIAGASWLESDAANAYTEYNYLSYYDNNFNMLAAINYNGALHIHGSVEIDIEKSIINVDNSGCTTFQIAFVEGADPSQIAYFRINGIYGGTNMVVTVDEDILPDICVYSKYTYKNQVPISTDTDGSIYNGVGYKENVRLSSSGGISGTAQTGSVTTGFIPFPYGDKTIIRMKGVNWVNVYDVVSTGHYYINFYDSSKKFLAYLSVGEAPNYTHVVTVTRDTNGVESIKWSETYGTSNSLLQYVRNQAAYIRITAYGKGANMIVTINEEIV